MKNPFAKKTESKEVTPAVSPENTLPPNAFEQALEQHQLGNLAQADALYRQILEQNPQHADALHFLGVLAYQVGQYDAAIELMKKAIQAEPNAAAVYGNLGLALQAAGQWDGAIQSYQQALILQPDFSAAHNNLGLAFQAQGQLNEALNSFQQAILTQPDYVEAYVNKANVLMAQNRMDEAIDCYRQVLSLSPDNPQIYNNLGYLLKEQGHFAEAIENFQRLLALTPNDAENHFKLGALFFQQQNLDAAIEYFQKTVALKPDYVEAYFNLALALKAQGNLQAAFENFQRAIVLKPDYAEAYNNLGITLQEQGKIQAALENYQQALLIIPDSAEIHCNIGSLLFLKNELETAIFHYQRAIFLNPNNAIAYYSLATVLYVQGKLDLAIENYQKALALKPDYPEAYNWLFITQLHCCDWSTYSESKEKIVAAIHANQAGYNPFYLLAISENAAYQQRCAHTHAVNHYLLAKTALPSKLPYRHEKIRIAYLSADFGEHPMTYLMAGLFEKHDRQRFEIIAISFTPEHKSSTGQRVKNAFAQFIDVSSLEDYEVALLIQKMEIDIAVDLMGFTTKNRTAIFSYRPAPVQINYLGYPATIGADYMDYIIADPYLVPERYQACYSEKVVYLPDCFQANDDKRVISSNHPNRSAAGLPETGLVFCSFNNSYKLTPVFFEVWMKILQSVPDSVLWLVADNQQVQNNLRKEAVKQGVNPERLIFAAKLPYAEHLARLQLADLFLDSLPFNAGTTASDALWAGVPIITCSGEAFAARMAGSLLHAVGLPELIADNFEEYKALALKLATTPDLLAEIRSKLAKNRTTYPLFNTDRFRKHIEAAYITMWERYQREEAPVSFAVEAIK